MNQKNGMLMWEMIPQVFSSLTEAGAWPAGAGVRLLRVPGLLVLLRRVALRSVGIGVALLGVARLLIALRLAVGRRCGSP